MTEAEALAAHLGSATYLLGEARAASLFLGACVSLLSLQINSQSGQRQWAGQRGVLCLDLEVLNNFPFK